MNKIIPLKLDGVVDNIYAGFESRFVAMLLDSIFFVAASYLLVLIQTIIQGRFQLFFRPVLISDIITALFFLWYYVYLTKKYGGTPGKLIMKIQVLRLDSSKIGWKEAFLRESIYIAIRLVHYFSIIISIQFLSIPDPVINIIRIMGGIWVGSELVVLLTNKRKRGLNDFIAGTVVVKKIYVEKIQELMKE